MCIGVLYDFRGHPLKVFFGNPSAKLPVKASFERITLIRWGRRESEKCDFPTGSWVNLELIKRGRLDCYEPKPVKIPLRKFLDMDFTGQQRWYDVVPGYWVQGMLAKHQTEHRVYIVTITVAQPRGGEGQWPRILHN